jgi:SPP1 gp7 family putative phage head morphogenesis protein
VTASEETLAHLEAMQVVAHGAVDDVTRATVGRWAAAWDELRDEWTKAAVQIVAMAEQDAAATSTAPRWPSRAIILRAERARQAITLTRNALEELAATVGAEVSTRLPQVVDSAVTGEARMIASQMPPQAGTQASLAASFGQVSATQVRAIVQRGVDMTLRPLAGLGSAVTDTVTRELARGVAMGTNPRVVAARMTTRLEGRFNGGAGRALTIARTEMLDATRAAGAMVDQRNSAVLGGWQWVAALDPRTCPSCWAQHGTVHPLDEPGPDDHANGRCARVPVTRSWADLGYPGIAEPASAVPDAQATFLDLTAKEQLQVMGPGRLALLRRGDVAWTDLSQERPAPADWRRSYQMTPLRDLQGLAAAA